MLSSKIRARCRTSLLWAVVGLLSSCGGGGGGGGGGGDTPPAANAQAALRLEAGNVTVVATDSLKAAENALRVAQHALKEIEAVARNGNLQFEAVCYTDGSNDGTRRYTLTDADGNRVPSAGDTLTIAYTACYADYFDGVIGLGTMTIRLTGADDPSHGAAAGTLDFDSGISTSLDGIGQQLTWTGTLQFRGVTTPWREELTVAATAADDLRRSVRTRVGSGSAVHVEQLRGVSLQRVLDRESARIRVSGSLRLASEALGGRVDVSFAPEMAATLAAYADSGSLRIDGAAGARLTLSATATTGATALQAALDTNGDGTAESGSTLAWRDAMSGYLWSDLNLANHAVMGPRHPGFVRLLSLPEHRGATGWGTDVSQPLRVQFDRPLRADTPIHARIIDDGPAWLTSGGTAPMSSGRSIEVRVQHRGAAFLFEPVEALRDGHAYRLQTSSDPGFGIGQAVVLSDAAGTAQMPVSGYFGLGASFASDGRLWPALSGVERESVLQPGANVAVRATAPFATALPLRYRWTQLDGPTLQIAAADTAEPSLQLGAGAPPGLSSARLRVTVTDATGRSNTEDATVQIANPAGVSSVWLTRSSAGSVALPPQAYALSSQEGQFEAVQYIGGGTWPPEIRFRPNGSPSHTWSLKLTGPGATLPAVGLYTGAYDAASLLDPTAPPAPMFDLSGEIGCGTRTGRFEVLDIAFDAAGKLVKLAVDYELPCDQRTNNVRTVRGSLRFESAVPVPLP